MPLSEERQQIRWINVVKSIVQPMMLALLAAGLSLSSPAYAEKMQTIGWASPVDAVTDAPLQQAFRDALQGLGYIDGKNVKMIVRYANGDHARLRSLIAELVGLPVDVLVSEATVAKQATTSIPIVSPAMGDPVKAGLVASLAKPGANLTGLSDQSSEIWRKQVELAREVVPGVTRVCVLYEAIEWRTGHAQDLRTFAREAGINVCALPVRTIGEIRRALDNINQERAQLVIVWASPLIYQYRDTIMSAVAHRLPVIGEGRELAEAGALLTYSADYVDIFRRSAEYVSKILKGAKPGDLPIEQPTKFVLVANAKTAKALGLKVPETILVRADEVIK